ncbi:unnamed protein product [Ostreobium quekettii]|uniref:Uncharacterized protein n=1 Tax=Ostreobium quekettii TaxID=121088 RepID=A0A8S1IT00_9CHLO|nr:unnamed protein product [Ostreobium quekettii]|eukprot:evm.model.scf_822.6 EVM.evm.TU.scf_822.6   scf_822:32261-34135(-)
MSSGADLEGWVVESRHIAKKSLKRRTNKPVPQSNSFDLLAEVPEDIDAWRSEKVATRELDLTQGHFKIGDAKPKSRNPWRWMWVVGGIGLVASMGLIGAARIVGSKRGRI